MRRKEEDEARLKVQITRESGDRFRVRISGFMGRELATELLTLLEEASPNTRLNLQKTSGVIYQN